MNLTHTDASITRRCRECGAENMRDAVHCWLCLREDWREEDDDVAPPFPIGRAAGRGILVLLVLIGLAILLFPRAPLVSVVLLGIVVPAMLIGEARSLRAQRWGATLSGRERLATVIKYAAILTPLVILVTIAAIVLRVAEFFGEQAVNLPP